MPGPGPGGAVDPDGTDGPGILHVDMDAFFAAVEVLDDPSLAGRPLIVGGEGDRGVVASCSYEARRFGVRSAMPSRQARRRCPGAVFRPGRYERYGELSRQMHEVFHRFTPLVEGIALDEAFLDVRGARRLLGTAPVVAVAVRSAIKAELGLACSVGVASTKFVAKLASEAAKPSADRLGIHPGRGVVVIEVGGELPFLDPLPVEAVWGVGPATAARLRALGITTVGQLAAAPVDAVERSLGPAVGRHLHDLARGIDPRPVEPDRPAKSVGHEETYARDRRDRDGLHREVVRMADAVGARLRRAGLSARTVQLKVRFADFATITRARSVSAPISTGPAIERVASALLDGVDIDGGVRLLGVSVSMLGSAGAVAPEQLSLGLTGADASPRHAEPARSHDDASRWGRGVVARQWEAATVAVDAVRARYGDAAVGPAALLGPGGIRVGRSGDNRWGAVPVTSPADDEVDP
jgi:DNA polymerase-4